MHEIFIFHNLTALLLVISVECHRNHCVKNEGFNDYVKKVKQKQQ